MKDLIREWSKSKGWEGGWVGGKGGWVSKL